MQQITRRATPALTRPLTFKVTGGEWDLDDELVALAEWMAKGR